MPGEVINPQAPQNHPEDRTYQILRELENQKVQAAANTLAALTDVSVPAPVNGQVLTWVTADNEWEALTPSAGNTISSTAYASRPAGAQGDGFLPTDGFEFDRKGASVWAPFGPIFPFTAPPTGGWSWDNPGTASVDTTRGGIYLTDVGGDTATKGRVRYRTAPGTPYTITFFLLHNCLSSKQYPSAGVMFRESATGKLVSMHQTAGNIFWTRWTNSGAVFADYTSLGYAAPLNWMQLTYDGTNLHFLHSADGITWVDHLGAKAKADFFTTAPDQVAFFVNSLNLATPNHPVSAWLGSYKEA